MFICNLIGAGVDLGFNQKEKRSDEDFHQSDDSVQDEGIQKDDDSHRDSEYEYEYPRFHQSQFRDDDSLG